MFLMCGTVSCYIFDFMLIVANLDSPYPQHSALPHTHVFIYTYINTPSYMHILSQIHLQSISLSFTHKHTHIHTQAYIMLACWFLIRPSHKITNERQFRN